jgi:hypothetical protein
MMTKQPVFPLADTPDVDLEQARRTSVAGGETFATAERIQFDSELRAAITSASTGFMAHLTGIVIVNLYACGGMRKNRTGRRP